MKKLLSLTLALGLFLGGCGGPTPKEEGKMIYDKYVSSTSTLGGLMQKQMDVLNKPDFNKSDEWVKTNTLLRQEIEKVKNEKVSDKVKSYKDTVVITSEIIANTIDAYVAIVKADKTNDTATGEKYLKQVELAGNEFRKALYKEYNEKNILDTGKPLPTMTVNAKEYVCSIASDVSMCVTNYKETERPVSDGFSTPIAPIGKFVYVTVAVYNNQKDAISINSNNFKIVYNDREYSHHPTAQFTYEIANKKRTSSTLNPGMGIDHTYIFDVPKDFKHTRAKVQARGGFTGDKTLLRIPALEKPAN